MVEEGLELSRGAVVYDTVAEVLAEVMEVQGQSVALRRTNGGVEWSRSKEFLRPPTATDRMRPAVAAANARSRGEL
jgi:hypothetical protein